MVKHDDHPLGDVLDVQSWITNDFKDMGDNLKSKIFCGRSS